ncbi:putative addiction module antidote protein [Pirellulales bacterium]|nr:putative addiction module antidote protein [Pirellulales bacterium]
MEDLADSVEAADYLTSSIEEGQEVFLLALRDVAKAQGGMAKLAEVTDCPRESLYQILSADGNPSLSKIPSVLEALGIQLQFVPAEHVET